MYQQYSRYNGAKIYPGTGMGIMKIRCPIPLKHRMLTPAVISMIISVTMFAKIVKSQGFY